MYDDAIFRSLSAGYPMHMKAKSLKQSPRTVRLSD